MPNLVGIGNSQVPTNAMLGGLAYQDSVGEINLEKIKAQTADTAVEIFVYDTRKDSDGGAWRHRTQNTSWYNEGVSAKRGARKEFPAVAVIVIGSQNLTIYDGDDPNLPMWMDFDYGSSGLASITMLYANGKGVSALNGIVCSVGASGWNDGLTAIDFIADNAKWRNSSYIANWTNGIGNRNVAGGYGSFITAPNEIIVAAHVNDVAMTVLPNAPINVSTGLPIPTIALATNSGVSVIKDDGSVVDLITSHSGYEQCNFTGIADNQVLLSFESSGSTTARRFWIHTIPSSDTTVTSSVILQGNASEFYKDYNASFSGNALNYHAYPDYKITNKTLLTSNYLYLGLDKNLAIIHRSKYSAGGEGGMLCGITTNFNTGWQQGDIKGAFLSSTDDTDITGTNLYLDDFSNNNKGWSFADNGSDGISGGVMTIATSASARATDINALTGVATGTKLLVQFTVTFGAAGTLTLDDDGAGAGQGGNTNLLQATKSGSGTQTFSSIYTKTGSDRVRFIRTSGGNFQIDNFVMKILPVDDRSVKNNGLAVYGTITKSPVATGAELVAYGNFSTSNYLSQPFNTDMNLSDGAFTIIAWIYPTNDDLGGIISRGSGGVYGPYALNYSSKDITFVSSADWNESNDGGSWGTLIQTSGDFCQHNKWSQVVVTKSGSTAKVFINGIQRGEDTSAVNPKAPTSNFIPTMIGVERVPLSGTINRPFPGRLALIRASNTAATKDQVEKIYNDEKCLYHKNAKCALYGTSDNVKALAFDDTTNVLHVGTSSGRSEFQGLNRINNTTTAVTTSISASNELVAEQ